MPKCIIALGANLPGQFSNPASAVEAGIRAVEEIGTLIGRSRLYRSAAWPDPGEPEFTNAVALYDFQLAPDILLSRLHAIEAAFGRTRDTVNAPRPLDLDIIDYDGRVSAPTEIPVLPHPRMTTRSFVLLPMAEIAPGWRHPLTGRAIADLIAALPSQNLAAPL